MQGKSRGPDGGGGRRQPPARHFDPYGKRTDFSQQDERGEGVIEGRNAILEALRAGVVIDKLFIAKGEADASLKHIASVARQAGAAVVDADRRKLDSMSVTNAHQGVIAMAACAEYVEISDIVKIAEEKGEELLIVLCDEISDPHNLGAIIRTCEASGAHGVVIPKRRSAGLSATVAKASSGAVYHTPIARVTNMTAAINELKKAGVWVFGASSEGPTALWEADFKGPVALVVGAEGAGISRLVRENCDFNVSIPMYGKIESLNASVSAAILMYEAVRQRKVLGIRD